MHIGRFSGCTGSSLVMTPEGMKFVSDTASSKFEFEGYIVLLGPHLQVSQFTKVRTDDDKVVFAKDLNRPNMYYKGPLYNICQDEYYKGNLICQDDHDYTTPGLRIDPPGAAYVRPSHKKALLTN